MEFWVKKENPNSFHERWWNFLSNDPDQMTIFSISQLDKTAEKSLKEVLWIRKPYTRRLYPKTTESIIYLHFSFILRAISNKARKKTCVFVHLIISDFRVLDFNAKSKSKTATATTKKQQQHKIAILLLFFFSLSLSLSRWPAFIHHLSWISSEKLCFVFSFLFSSRNMRLVGWLCMCNSKLVVLSVL